MKRVSALSGGGSVSTTGVVDGQGFLDSRACDLSPR